VVSIGVVVVHSQFGPHHWLPFVVGYLVAATIALARRRLPLGAKAGFLIGSVGLIAVNALVGLGLSGAGLLLLVVVAVLATVFFGMRGGAMAAVASVAITGVVGALVSTGVVVPDPDLATHLAQGRTWVNAAVVFALVLAVAVVGPGLLESQIERLLARITGQAAELREAVSDLLREKRERERTEAEKAVLEQHLAEAQKMEAIGTLAGGVAHDFNNLLTVIGANVGLALMDDSGSAAVREHLHEVEHATRRASELVGKLLAFSRRQIIDVQVIDLSEHLRRFEPMARRLVGEQVDLDMDLEDGLAIRVDVGQLERVLVNLVANARDAMPERGRLSLHSRREACPGPTPLPSARISVSDTGSGMDPDTLSRIFEPFFTTKEAGKGTGLGLAAVYGIVNQHGGLVEARSTPGTGTTIDLWIPLADEHPEALPDLPEGELPRGGEAILLVEDDALVRRVAERVLRRLGYRVTTASDGEEACEVASVAEPVDLLLTDVVMPRRNGREVASYLSERWPALKVLFTSGHTEDAIVHHGVLDPGVSFLGKPYSPADLAHAVRQVLDAGSPTED